MVWQLYWHDQNHDNHVKEFKDATEFQTFLREYSPDIVSYLLYIDGELKFKGGERSFHGELIEARETRI